jgi:hypothetical protein
MFIQEIGEILGMTYVAYCILRPIRFGKQEGCADATAVRDRDRDTGRESGSGRSRHSRCTMSQEGHDSSVCASNHEDSNVTPDPIRKQGEQEITSADKS